MKIRSLNSELMPQKWGGACTWMVTLPKAYGPFLENQLHINELELKAIHFAVQAFGDRLKNKHVKMLCDNSTTRPGLSHGNLAQPHVLWMRLQLVGNPCIFMLFPLSVKFTDACKTF